ncbi:hypothetical protein ACWCOP_00855 [Maricaulaceae bacterium MS644]
MTDQTPKAPETSETLEATGTPPARTVLPATAPEADAVDRPGFDLGGSTGETRAGTGVGLGPDAGESRRDRRLPGRRPRRR